MTAAYSIDFRKKIVEAYQDGKTSYSKVAKSFKVSVNSVKRYVKQYREDGNLLPKKGDKGRPSKIDEMGYEAIQKIIRDKPTITLAELSELYYKKRKVKAGRSILSRACLKLNLRRKKLSRYAAERERDDVKKKGVAPPQCNLSSTRHPILINFLPKLLPTTSCLHQFS